jgi:pilus assembly protein CpaB
MPSDSFVSSHRGELLIWLIAAGAAIATALGARSFLQRQTLEANLAAEARFGTTPTVVAKTDLLPGSTLAADMLAMRNMPAAFLPASTVSAADAGSLLGRKLEHALRAGEPLQIALLAPRATQRLTELITLGRRAVTLAVDEVASAAGQLSPGDRVDLLWGPGDQRSLRNVPVLATGARLEHGSSLRGPGEFATVTVELTDREARRVALADSGQLRILLRNPFDTGATDFPGKLELRQAASTVLISGGSGGPSPRVQMLPVGL